MRDASPARCGVGEWPYEATRLLDAAGLGARGVLAAADYDARVPPAWRCDAVLPGAVSAVMLGAGGRDLFTAFACAPEARLATDPLDAYVMRVVTEAATRVASAGARAALLFAHESREGAYADFVALARACGLGAPSRLGLLLHSVYGPWLSLRAILLTDLPLTPTPPCVELDPCASCDAPCARACHGAALAGSRIDVAACFATRRREPACALRCDARRACPIGAEHAYAAEAEEHHMRASRAYLEGGR